MTGSDYDSGACGRIREAARRHEVEVEVTENPSDDGAIEEVARRLRAGMQQRRAEVAALADARRGSRVPDLERARYLEEPISISARPKLGRLIVVSRKIFYHLFLKWYMRPIVQQQNGFNDAATRRVQELLERIDSLERRLDGSTAESRRDDADH